MKNILPIFLSALVLFSACKKKDKDEDDPIADFNRQAMLQNMGENIVIPNYSTLDLSLDSLQELTQQFVTSPDLTLLGALRAQWLVAYKNWMHCSVFEFGPASNTALRAMMNTFPADTVQINSNISAGTWSLGSAANIDAIGFPAIDFLIHSLNGNDAQVLDRFITDPQAANRKNYLTDLVNDMKSKISQVLNAWKSTGGNYIQTFINASGTDVGSSVGFLVNQICYDYELTKNPRIGIPLGKRTLDVPLPDKVEAFYGGHSVELAAEHVKAVDLIFAGESRSGNNGQGLDDYLDHVDARTNGQSLASAIRAKLSEVISAIEAIPGRLSDAVVNNAPLVNTAYTRILEALVMLKTEMPSALGVLITYQDSDGD